MAIKIPYEFTPTNLSAAVAGVGAFTDAASKSVAGVAKQFTSLQNIVAGVFAGFTISKFIKEATEGQDAALKLNFALAQSGDLTAKNVESFNRFAAALQRSTGVQDDAIITQLSFAKSLGLTNDQSQKLVKTAIDLAKFTGDTLDGAVSQLTKTLNGQAGALGKLFPEIKRLGIESLTSGGALDLISARVGGLAAQLTNTFSGATTLASRGAESLAESLGQIVTESPVIIQGIKGISTLFFQFADAISQNQGAFRGLLESGFKALVSFIPVMIRGLQALDFVITKIGNGFTFLSGAMASVIARFTNFNNSSVIAAEIGKQAAKDNADANAAFDARSKIYDQLTKSSNNYVSSLSTAVQTEVKIQKQASDAVRERTKAINDLIEAQKRQIRDATRTVVQKATQDPIGGFSGAGISDAFRNIEGVQNSDLKKAQDQAKIGATVGLISTAFKGAEGAATAISSILGAAADKLVPGIGGVIGEITKVLAQGPEKVQEFITGFVQAIPKIVSNIALSLGQLPAIFARQIGPLLQETFKALPDILLTQLPAGIPDLIVSIAEQTPVIIQSIVDCLPTVLQRFADGIAETVAKLISAIPQIVNAFVVQLPRAAVEFGIALAKQAPTIAIQFVDALVKEAPRFITELVKSLPSLVGGGALGGIGGGLLGGIGGGIPGLGDLGGLFGFASGGMVPAGFPGDSFPAKLTSGELIIPPGDTRRLSQFLDRQQQDTRIDQLAVQVQRLTAALSGGGGTGAQTLNVNVNVGEENLANAQSKIKRQGFRQ